MRIPVTSEPSEPPNADHGISTGAKPFGGVKACADGRRPPCLVKSMTTYSLPSPLARNEIPFFAERLTGWKLAAGMNIAPAHTAGVLPAATSPEMTRAPPSALSDTVDAPPIIWSVDGFQ